MPILFDNINTDQDSDVFKVSGTVVVNLKSTLLDTAIVEIQTTTPNDPQERFTTLPNATFSADTSVTLNYLPEGTTLKAVLSGSTVNTLNVFVDVIQ